MIRKAKVTGGTVVGIPAADPRITAFKGVPFAAPPVGENRWRAPQPVIPWEGERQCFTFAPISMQHIPGLDLNNIYSREWNVDPTIPMSEDCLYLNVWTPAKTADERLPVFVWFFGGGLREGNTTEMEFDGERIARRGIVVVTVNYRVTVFGFLAHPELTAQQPDAPSNFGHLDQLAGIRWAKENIAAFGGDPDNITIGGQSAGGGSVCAQLTSPLTEGLFKKAVIMSGFTASVYPNPIHNSRPFSENEATGVRFFDFLGVKTLEEARKLDAVYIRDKCNEFEKPFTFTFATATDGVFQTGSSNTDILNGRFRHMPLLITRTSSEFRVGMPAGDMAQFREKARELFGARAEEFLAACGDDPETAKEKASVCVIDTAARVLAAKEEALGIPDPLYYAVFDPSIPGWDDPGTFHSSDLWFWFETLAKCWRPFKGYHYDLARQMCNYLANFIRSGDPNGPDNDGVPMPQWRPMRGGEANAMWLRDRGCECLIDGPDTVSEIITEAVLRKES